MDAHTDALTNSTVNWTQCEILGTGSNEQKQKNHLLQIILGFQEYKKTDKLQCVNPDLDERLEGCKNINNFFYVQDAIWFLP